LVIERVPSDYRPEQPLVAGHDTVHSKVRGVRVVSHPAAEINLRKLRPVVRQR
jgi:hypothetical protein